jgi:DUF4097 and DUF4098 domain-containing protein YvlB
MDGSERVHIANLHISNRSGAILVTAVAGARLDVGNAEIERDAESGDLRVRGSKPSKPVVVRCPEGTDLVLGTVSGNVEVKGTVGAVKVATVSGNIRVEHAASLDVRTKSGTVDVGECEGDCNVVVTSSTVKVGEAGHAKVSTVSGRIAVDQLDDAKVQSVSGKVELGARGGGQVLVQTVSGNVDVSVPTDRAPSTALKSFSGRVACDCDAGSDGEIRVRTMSGAIRIRCR